MDYWGGGGGGGGKYVCVQSMWQTRRGLGACFPGKFVFLDLLLDTIWWNLGLFSHKHHLMCQ